MKPTPVDMASLLKALDRAGLSTLHARALIKSPSLTKKWVESFPLSLAQLAKHNPILNCWLDATTLPESHAARLMLHGINTVGELVGFSSAELRGYRMIGVEFIRTVTKVLHKEFGLRLSNHHANSRERLDLGYRKVLPEDLPDIRIHQLTASGPHGDIWPYRFLYPLQKTYPTLTVGELAKFRMYPLVTSALTNSNAELLDRLITWCSARKATTLS